MVRSALLVTLCLAAAPSWAGSSEWHETEGGRVRLVTDQAGGGQVLAALEIELEPGWKTYWRDPGDAGIAPSVKLEGNAQVEIGYPAPRRFDEAGTVFAGYKDRVAFPLTVGGAGSNLDAVVFLGICRSICVPLEAHLSASTERASASERESVKAAFASLPRQADDATTLTAPAREGKTITMRTGLPAGTPDVEFFIAAPQGWAFSQPRPFEQDGHIAFAVDVAWKPKDAETAGRTVPYLIVVGGEAYQGMVALP